MRSLTLLISLLFLIESNAFQTPALLHTGASDRVASTQLVGSPSCRKAISVTEPPPTTTNDLPPLLQNIVDDRHEFEMNLGKAMDVLRHDYPDMLTTTPEFSIYHENLNVVDPSGVQLIGISSYKKSFQFLQALVGLFYNVEKSSVQFRMVYDFARQSIRISFNVMLVPKVVGNDRNSLYIDGISVYKMDSMSGKIIEHRVENLVFNDTPVVPPYGIFTAIRNEIFSPSERQGVPVGVGAMFSPP
mmetsp:Transcript_6304/g.9148  ORF Transcript_6304/g.9148 Transcript_6304/m.9148 type:complete len:245 (-) Transcript_6304:452-1186(-)|eukprot:CAMPEP_0195518846 /NCGR_PEP_ID=MMETSP0794_2-20130614/13782_1 /TAXON_ID=515487 /ORGANISM="Stephanopyxis turris, Strain CCMP 815" /LENGTH=244 /DNA_ID=CAMNT_0040647875 /DNA_START=80 /DNA_END=814 /DNA_ORIENTATION=+